MSKPCVAGSHLVAVLHHHERGLREATAEAKLAQLLADPATPECLTADDSYRPVAVPSVSVSVSVHPVTTSVPMCQPSLHPHASAYRNARERGGVDLESACSCPLMGSGVSSKVRIRFGRMAKPDARSKRSVKPVHRPGSGRLRSVRRRLLVSERRAPAVASERCVTRS
jgi:hypothetical protein